MNFIQRYDPAKFGLFFALKATISFIVSVAAGYFAGEILATATSVTQFLADGGALNALNSNLSAAATKIIAGANTLNSNLSATATTISAHAAPLSPRASAMLCAIFAANASICIFFLDSLDGDIRAKSAFLALYAVLGVGAVCVVAWLYWLGWVLLCATFAWVFFAQITPLYNANLGKIFGMTTMTGIVTLVSLTSTSFALAPAALGCALGAAVAGVLRLGRFGKYGKFTARTNVILLDDLQAMCREVAHPREFDAAQSRCAEDIARFKEIFEHKSSSIKNSASIIFHAKAIFYLYKLEDIFHALVSLRAYEHNMPESDIVAAAFGEISHNLGELKKIFAGEKPTLTRAVFNAIAASEHRLFAASLAVAYDKFDLIDKGGQDEILLQRKKRRTLREAARLISLKNETTLNALRIATSVTLAFFIAFATGVEHGVWIAIGVITISKQTSYQTRQVGLKQMAGNCVGLLAGLVLVGALQGFAGVFYVALLGVIFAAFYLRGFPIFYFYVAFMAAFVMVFYLIQPHFLALVLWRFADIFIGFLLAFGLSFAFKNRSNRLILKTKFQAVLRALKNLLELRDFAKKEGAALAALADYKTAIRQSDGRTFGELRTSLTLYKALEETNSLIANLRDYTRAGAVARTDAALANDVKIIAVRFEMIEKKLCALPYYFYDDVEARWLCRDERALFLLRKIAALQEVVVKRV